MIKTWTTGQVKHYLVIISTLTPVWLRKISHSSHMSSLFIHFILFNFRLFQSFWKAIRLVPKTTSKHANQVSFLTIFNQKSGKRRLIFCNWDHLNQLLVGFGENWKDDSMVNCNSGKWVNKSGNERVEN